MSLPLYVAFIWHQHQPLYKSPIAGKYRMPWVRLHGVKDYLDLVLLLAKYPKLHQTVNLVPSLIAQLQDYSEGNAFDPYLELTLTPVANFDADQRRFVAERFFDAYHHTMVEPYPRYAQLLAQKKQYGTDWCVANWTHQDFSDLLAWHNLTWIDPLFRETDPQIKAWFDRGEGFTLSDRQLIYTKQKEIIAQILPQHHAMQAQGQLELTTTPYTHPIMPLLADNYAGRVAVSDMLLPGIRYRWDADINLHLEKSKRIYRKHFECEPRGLWPSEQSVSPAILPHVAKHGFSWLCSDEGVLGWSLGHYFRRDERGGVLEPHLLYQPYRLETMHGDLAIVFRDRRLSDLIGFSYSSMSPQAACDDLYDHLESIHVAQQEYLQNNPSADSKRPWLVTIALDGENCWEYYPQDGKPFLETLYERFSKTDDIQLVTVSEFVEHFPPVDKIPPHQLHSGSWIDANFTTWIGDPIKNRAWDLLAETRQVLANHTEATQENNPEAWENLFAAEGSDWFWWFGDGHNSDHDHVFDQLFREHLQAVYRALNEPVPTGLMYPLEPHDVSPSDRPTSFIHPVIDGRVDKQDWDGAGRLEIGGMRGTMHQASLVQRLWYGVDHFNVYLRLDFHADLHQGELNKKLLTESQSTLHLLWFYPEQTNYNSPIQLTGLPYISPLNYLFHHHLTIDLSNHSIDFQEAIEDHQWKNMPTQAKMGLDQCLEIAVPWCDLVVKPQSLTRLVVMLSRNGQFQTSLPEYTIIPIEVP
ncbi:glycoside hydrolase [Tumidithrix elongata RA019]|uniref:Glycoside hydrolase n=1 Tax=Tumidithrix elongata BACA0141 TaxID=2716417 RepID=A0AAW9PX02_9CYAN|nr:glycoside hydrolase [Tumidithrix elongata RA019]